MGSRSLLHTPSGADPGFQFRGGALKKIAPSGGRRENFWCISCEKSRFYAKKSYFFQLPREARKFWGISCEKSRFYANFFNFFRILGGRAPGAPPLPWIRPCYDHMVVTWIYLISHNSFTVVIYYRLSVWSWFLNAAKRTQYNFIFDDEFQSLCIFRVPVFQATIPLPVKSKTDYGHKKSLKIPKCNQNL